MEKIKKVMNELGEWIQNPSPGELLDGEMTAFDEATGEMEGTGDINTDLEVNFGTKNLLCKTVVTESLSVDVGPGITLSDKGGYLDIKSNMTNNSFLPIDSKITTAGSEKPTWDKRDPIIIRDIIQDVFSTEMLGVTSYVITPEFNQDVSRVYLKLINPVTNFRSRIISSATSEVVKYIPTRANFDKGIGISLGVGEQFYDIPSALGELQGLPITVEIFADQSIDLLGDGTNIWRGVDRNIIPKNLKVLDETDILDEDDFISDSIDKAPSQRSTKKYIEDIIGSSVVLKNGYDADLNVPNLEDYPTGVLLGWMYVVSVAGTFFSKSVKIGDSLISNKDDPTLESHWILLQKNMDAATIKALYESNSNTEAFETLEKSNLGILIGSGETNLHYHSSDRNRSNHTGTQTASTISDFDTEVSNNPYVEGNTVKVSYPGAAQVKADYESNPDTNVFTDLDKSNLDNIYASGAINAVFIEINSDTTLSADTNFIVDTTNNVVNINIPFGVTNPFTIRDGYKKFNKTYSCIVNVKDSGGVTVHTAELDKKDKGWVFYHNGVDWVYGEIGKGKIIVVSSDHTASTDFGILNEAADDYTYEEIKGGILYKALENMIDDPRSLVSKSYVDNLPSGGSSEYGELYVTVRGTMTAGTTPLVIEFDTAGVSSGITVDTVNNRINILSTGVHRISYNGSVFLKKNETYFAHIYVNGLNVAEFGGVFTSLDNLTHPFGFSRPIQLTAGDYVEIYTSCTSSKDFDLSPGSSFNIEKM